MGEATASMSDRCHWCGKPETIGTAFHKFCEGPPCEGCYPDGEWGWLTWETCFDPDWMDRGIGPDDEDD